MSLSGLYAKDMILLYSESKTEHDWLADVLANDVPKAIHQNVTELNADANGLFCRFHQTDGMMFVANEAGRLGGGYITIGLALGESAKPYFGVIPLRFAVFKTNVEPHICSTVANAIKPIWPKLKIVDDLEVAMKKAEEEKRQREEAQRRQWAAQGLCSSCGGQLGFMRKCKSCGQKN